MIFYYDAEKNIYPTQLDAVASGKPCFFYYYDKEFMQVDWKTEPTESLQELYRIRAQQIRDENEYVIVCYSGGSDSTNILETFYYNNIHIDEIVVVGALSQDPEQGSDFNHNGDLYHNVFPTLTQMNFPNTKITVLDYTQWFNDPTNFTLIQKYGNEWSKYIGGFKSVHNLFWYDFRKFVGKGNNKQTCYIMGSDKTIIYHGKIFGSYYTKISDLSVNDYGANYSDENFKRINFYISPEKTTTDIMRKQGHRLINYVNLKYIGKYDTSKIDQTFIYYNLKHPLQFKSKKSTYTALSARDKFMLNATNSEMFNMFTEGLRTIEKVTSTKNRIYFHSRKYWLTDSIETLDQQPI